MAGGWAGAGTSPDDFIAWVAGLVPTDVGLRINDDVACRANLPSVGSRWAHICYWRSFYFTVCNLEIISGELNVAILAVAYLLQ